MTVYSGFFLTVNVNSSINRPPYFVGNGLSSPLSATVGIPVSISTAYGFADPEGRLLTYSTNVNELPTGLKLNPATGVISGTPSIPTSRAGITVGATDDGGSIAYSGFYITTVNGSGSGRLTASSESATSLQVRVLGNPVEGNTAEAEIRGAPGQTLQLKLVDLQGKLLHQQRINEAGSVERVSVPMGTGRGLLLLQVSTTSEHQQVKLLKN